MNSSDESGFDGCAECVRLRREREAASLAGELSHEVDCAILLQRHMVSEHPAVRRT
ncbi:hypothetical protein MTQ01_16365 [Streptomyces sp. XM4193]|uniref:hypothetical protein n=1 Tax=Streptomyces sp. XM4193 TaxID=2929782 RepID=UPI001FF7859C|nr:hypothetical protein [Streptomyces sp. XM4193]MCK1797572.1 hypothetical protein [Streptomyces sp. XM4193]